MQHLGVQIDLCYKGANFLILHGGMEKFSTIVKTSNTSELPLGRTNQISRNLNEFENNTFNPLKSNISNGVMPLQYYTNEYQISQPAVTNSQSFEPDMVSLLPMDACSDASLWSSNDLMGTGNLFIWYLFFKTS